MSKGYYEASSTATYAHRPYPPDACTEEGTMLMLTSTMQTAGAVTNIKIKNVIDYRFHKTRRKRHKKIVMPQRHTAATYLYIQKKDVAQSLPCTSPQ